MMVEYAVMLILSLFLLYLIRISSKEHIYRKQVEEEERRREIENSQERIDIERHEEVQRMKDKEREELRDSLEETFRSAKREE